MMIVYSILILKNEYLVLKNEYNIDIKKRNKWVNSSEKTGWDSNISSACKESILYCGRENDIYISHW